MNKNILAILILVLVALMYPFFIAPLWGDVTRVRESIDELETTIEKAEEFEMKRDELVERRNNITEEELEVLNNALPDKIDPIQFIVSFQDMARARGLVVTGDISVSGSVLEGGGGEEEDEDIGYKTLTLSTNLLGSYTAINRLVNDLAQSFPVIDVNNLSFSESNERGRTQRGVSSYSIEVTTRQFNNIESNGEN